MKKINFKIKTRKMVILNNDTSDRLAHSTVVLKRKYYFFEILNADQLATGKTLIPIVQERGPYVYKLVTEKRHIKFSEDGTNVSYTPVQTFDFDPELSVGNDSDTFMFLNIPLLVRHSFIILYV